MWLIKDSKGKIKYLKLGKTVKFGRKQSDVVLANDTSISRSHATMSVKLNDQIKSSGILSTCIVKDENSKYGTLVMRDGIQMKVSNKGLELKPLDKIKFGLQQHIFIVEYIRLVTVTSRISFSEKTKLKEIMNCIGGLVIDCYDDSCTHLTMSSATSTNKVIFALIAGVPIVSIHYWTKVLEAVDCDSNLPDPNLFSLPLQDKGINTQRVSLQPNPKRKCLFQGKKFIIFSKCTYNNYEKMIRDAGGIPVLYSVDTTNILNILSNSNLIIQMTDADNESMDILSLNSILNKELQKKKMRMIAETEIPLAIMYVSLEQYCNPKYHFKELIMRKSLKEDTSEILAPDTQDSLVSGPDNTSDESASEKMCIPETNEYTQGNKEGAKEALTSNNYQQSPDLILIAKQLSSQNAFKMNSDVRLEENSFESTSSFKEPYTVNNSLSEPNFHKVIDRDEKNLASNNGTRLKRQNLAVSLKDLHESGISESENNKFTMKRKMSYVNESVNCKNSKINKIAVITNFESLELSQKYKSLQYRNDPAKKSEEYEGKEKNKLNKWEFKRKERKNINFDLDDFASDPAKDALKIKTSSTVINKESTCLSNRILSENRSQLPYYCESNNMIRIQSNSKSGKFSRKSNQTWTSVKSLEAAKTQNNYLKTVNIKNQCLVRSNIIQQSNEDFNDVKCFVKVHINIPAERIALSDMTR